MGSFRRRAAVLLWRVTPLLVAATATIWLVTRTPPPSSATAWPALLAAVAEGDAEAGAALAELAAADWPAMRPQVVAWTWHADAPVRAIATAILVDLSPQAEMAILLTRASDDDFRVRAAAFQGLRRLRRFRDGVPSRDTPITERDRILNEWIAAEKGSIDPHRTRCSLHRHPEQLRLSESTIRGCLRCHVGPSPQPPFQPLAEDCQACHSQIHTDWAGSAHANSVSHLTLRSIDPQTREPIEVRPEPLGLHCVACHAVQPANDPRGCLASFSRGASESCVACHRETSAEWNAWAQGPRPQRSRWLAGDVQLDASGAPASCVDCHMRQRSGDGTWTDHRWGARRDPAMLASAIHVAAGLRTDDGRLSLTVTNLAGHAFPTAIERRAIELRVQLEDDGEPQLAARWGPAQGDTADPMLQPPLGPGERRAFDITVPASTKMLRWSLVYHRYRHDPAALKVEIASGRVAIY